MNKHTPKPWTVVPNLEKKPDYWNIKRGRKHVASVSWDGRTTRKEAEANAHLIGLAPELAEALDALLDWALSNRGTEREFVTCRSGGDVHDPALDAARALVASARGNDG
jgi:hypothetical protein